MKTLKKALSIVLALALMLSCVAGMQVSVSAEGEDTTTPALVLSASNPQYDLANPPENGLVGITVRVGANAGFAALGYEVTYDEGIALHYVVKDGSIADYPITEENQAVSSEKLTDKPYKMQWAFTGNQTAENFTIAYLQFKAAEGTEFKAGDSFNVTFTVKEAWDEAGNAVAVTESFTSTIAVVDTTPVEPEGPVLDETIAPSTHTVAIGESFGIGFRFDLSTISEDYASFRIDIHRTTSTASFDFAYEDASYTTFSKNTKQNFMACTTTYYGIQLFSLTAPVEYTLHCFDAEGTEVAYSKTFTTTLADVAVGYHDLSTTTAPMKRVMADLIQVGAAALNHFTANRTKACDYSTLPVPTIDSEYITTELGALASYSSSEGVALTITGALQASPYFNMRFSEDVANKDQYEFKVSFYNALSKKDVTYPVGSAAMTGNTKTIATKLETFPIFATNADVTFELYKDGVVVGTTHYCLEKYIADTMATTSSATLKTLLQEVGEMAQSIRTARNI